MNTNDHLAQLDTPQLVNLLKLASTTPTGEEDQDPEQRAKCAQITQELAQRFAPAPVAEPSEEVRQLLPDATIPQLIGILHRANGAYYASEWASLDKDKLEAYFWLARDLTARFQRLAWLGSQD